MSTISRPQNPEENPRVKSVFDDIAGMGPSRVKKIMKDSIEFLKSDKTSDLSKEQLVDILREVHGFDK